MLLSRSLHLLLLQRKPNTYCYNFDSISLSTVKNCVSVRNAKFALLVYSFKIFNFLVKFCTESIKSDTNLYFPRSCKFSWVNNSDMSVKSAKTKMNRWSFKWNNNKSVLYFSKYAFTSSRKQKSLSRQCPLLSHLTSVYINKSTYSEFNSSKKTLNFRWVRELWPPPYFVYYFNKIHCINKFKRFSE